jgi:hypothetical protein
MKRTVVFLFVFALLGTVYPSAVFGRNWNKKLIKGSGHVISEARNVGEFINIEANSMLDMKISIGEKQSVVIYLDDNLIPLITTEVEDGWLIIENEKDWKTESKGRIEITVPALQEVESNGFGDVAVSGLSNDAFALDHNGAGDVELAGRVDELDIDVDGMGDIDAREVETRIASVKVNGMGDVHVRASERLRGKVNGMGTVFSYGKPEYVSVNVSGMGSLVER